MKATRKAIAYADTILISRNPEAGLSYKKHIDIHNDWLHGVSIWKLCDEYNLTIPEMEAVLRSGVSIAMARAKKKNKNQK